MVVNDASGATLTAAQGTTFQTTVDGTTYNYLVKEDTTITPASGVYTFSNLNVYEGTLVNNKYTVDTTNADQRFLIKNGSVFFLLIKPLLLSPLKKWDGHDKF